MNEVMGISDQTCWKETDPTRDQNGTKSPRGVGNQNQRLGKEMERERPEEIRSQKGK